MKKGTISEKCWNAAKGAVENSIQYLWSENCKREWSLKSVGTQLVELLRTVSNSGCLRAAKGNGLLKCWNTVRGADENKMQWWLFERVQKGTVS